MKPFLTQINNDFFAHVFAVSGFIFFGGPMTAICVLYVLIGVKLKRSRLLQAVPRRCYDVNRGISAQTRVIRMLSKYNAYIHTYKFYFTFCIDFIRNPLTKTCTYCV